MTHFENQTFEFFDDIDSGKNFSGVEFIHCNFVGCTFSSTLNVDLRSTAQHIRFVECKISGGYIGPGFVKDVLIDGLKVGNHLQTYGTVFQHVVLRGVIDKIMLTPYVDLIRQFPDVQNSFDNANSEFYRDIDWALDISEAFFKDCDIRGIPANLIIRDKETQVVLKRKKVLQYKWKEIDLSKTYWTVAIENFINDGFDDCVLVAPKKNREFKVLLEGLDKLRKLGVAESD